MTDNGACSYRRFLEGDEKAFDGIFSSLFPSLVRFVFGFVHDMQAAEDIAIDSFSDLIVHRYRYNFKVTLKTYLFMIGRSRALDYIKHHKKLNFVALSEAEQLFYGENTPEEVTFGGERVLLIKNALSKLSLDMQTVILLIYYENLSYDEAAKVMKKNRKQIDNLLYRAKNELRNLLGEAGKEFL